MADSKLVKFLLDHNQKMSDEFSSPDVALWRDKYRCEHPTEIAEILDDHPTTVGREIKPFYTSKYLIYAWLYSVWRQNYTKYLYQKSEQKEQLKENATVRFSNYPTARVGLSILIT